MDINVYEKDYPCDRGLADQRLSCLTWSIKQEDMETATLLLHKGANVDSPAGLDSGLTPLQAACIVGHIGMVMKLLRLGADPNAPGASRRGRTVLEKELQNMGDST